LIINPFLCAFYAELNLKDIIKTYSSIKLFNKLWKTWILCRKSFWQHWFWSRFDCCIFQWYDWPSWSGRCKWRTFRRSPNVFRYEHYHCWCSSYTGRGEGRVKYSKFNSITTPSGRTFFGRKIFYKHANPPVWKQKWTWKQNHFDWPRRCHMFIENELTKDMRPRIGVTK